MNFFETELKKIMEKTTCLKEQTYVGRICYGVLNDMLRVKIEFTALHISEYYDAVRITIINKNEGVVDRIIFRFSEIWGIKETNQQNIRCRIEPHIYSSGGKYSWGIYQPVADDYQRLVSEAEQYLSVFL